MSPFADFWVRPDSLGNVFFGFWRPGRAGPAIGVHPGVRFPLLPWALVAFAATRPRGAGRRDAPVLPALPAAGRLAAASLGFALVGVLAAVAVGYQDPGEPKQGRILVDESHGQNWEFSGAEFDKEAYGPLATYSYSSLVEYLEHFYAVDLHEDGRLTPAVLETCDVLLLKVPTSPYGEDELEAIEAFVRGGGGLWLISDHTDLFGMSTYINPVARTFGMEFGPDDTFDLSTSNNNSYRRPDRLAHPAVQNLPEFDFLTSCSIQPLSWRLEPVIVGNALGRELLDYGQRFFFGNMAADPEDSFGLFLQAAARKHGAGRVLAFSDSTVFSTFSMFHQGKPELALGSVEYLNRRNLSGDAPNRVAFWAAALLALGLALWLLRSSPAALPPAAALGLLAGWLPAAQFLTGRNAEHYPLPEPREDYVEVVFDAEHSQFTLPVFTGVTPEEQVEHDAYDGFYSWVQRLGGAFPSIASSLDEGLERADVLVLLNPTRDFEAGELARLRHWIGAGGRLLVLDSIFNGRGTSNQVLEPLGLGFELVPLEVGRHEPVADLRFDFTVEAPFLALLDLQLDRALDDVPSAGPGLGVLRMPMLSATGGQPLWVAPNGAVLAAVKPFGRGAVVLCSDSYTFSRAGMGGSWAPEPSALRRELYETQYELFEELVFGEPATSGDRGHDGELAGHAGHDHDHAGSR